MKNYVIITDVTSDMSPEIREHFGLDGYVHGYVHISDGRDAKTTLDWENISRDEYYAALNSKSLEVSIMMSVMPPARVCPPFSSVRIS